MKKENNRIAYIDFMNILACFGVICLHCSGYVFDYGNVETRLWALSMLVQTITHWAIPVFFMITGTTLLEYRKNMIQKPILRKDFCEPEFLLFSGPFFTYIAPYLWRMLHFPNWKISGMQYSTTRQSAFSGFSIHYLQFICLFLFFHYLLNTELKS